MTTRIIVLHDPRIAREIQKLIRFNHRMTLFAVLTTASIIALMKVVDHQQKKIKELTEEADQVRLSI